MATELSTCVYEFSISAVVSDEDIMNKYIQYLNIYIKIKKTTLREILVEARRICDGLLSEEDLIAELKNDNNKRDKGLFGKIIELGLFAQKPNSSSKPDLDQLGYDIKSCGFKNLKNTGKNAKERQTLTNCGDTNNYDSFKNISDTENFADCQYYAKCRRFLLFVRRDEKHELKNFEQIINQEMLFIVVFDMEKLPACMKEAIDRDYASIRQCIAEKNVSQKGQKCLHIHPHGAGHGSGHRALGYTNYFITLVVAVQLSELNKKNIEDILIVKGRSIAIRNTYL